MLQKFNQLLVSYLGNYYTDVIHSVFAFILVLSIYSFLSFFVKNKIESIAQKRRYLVNLRNFSIVLLILIEIFLWSGEIKTFFISAIAIFAAFMVSFKELIMSFIGSLFITSNKLFSLGDIIQVNDIQGKVID
jgi:small-conductance mechanosensitive channel